jgi:hypothetical protein
MRVLVMLVVDVQMLVLIYLVRMRVLVAFAEMEPHAERRDASGSLGLVRETGDVVHDSAVARSELEPAVLTLLRPSMAGDLR